MSAQPPQWPARFLRWFCREDSLEEIEGDLIEIFYRQHLQSPWKARWFFFWNVIKHLRPTFIKSLKLRPGYHHTMIRSSFKLSFRRLIRNGNYAFINIAGLAVGIAVCMLIFIIIQFQTSFDSFHSKKDRIFRVLTEYHNAGETAITYGKSVPLPMPNGLQTAFPQIEQVAPVYASHNDELQILDDKGTSVKKFKEPNGVFYTQPSFFEIFDFPLLAGSYASLKDPNNVLLTKETAETYFGDWKTATGKTIQLTGSYRIGAGLFQFPPILLKVSGVLASIPPATDLQLKLVIAFGTDFTGDKEYGLQNPDWSQSSPDLGCFILMPSTISAANFSDQLSAYSKKMLPADSKDRQVIQPLREIHFDTQTGNFSNKATSHELINVWRLIGAFILLIACVNFINLSTAQSINRAREVGVRKALGSNNAQLQTQFIVETFLIVTSAILIAMMMVIFGLPYINQLLELSVSLHILYSPAMIGFLLITMVGITVLAGFYPSIVLSRFNPANVLKSKLNGNTPKGISLRRGLVVFQFIIAQGLIIATLIVVEQMNYFTNQPLGFDKEAIINVPFRPDSTGDKLSDYLRQQWLTVSGIQSVSFGSNTPIEDENEMWTPLKFDHAMKESGVQAIVKFADTGYAPTYKLQLVAGRNLQPAGWTKEFLVNESLVRSLGFKSPDDILNKEISILDDRIKCPVVGVLKDFNNRSFRNDLTPVLITTNNTMYRQAAIKLSTTDISSTLETVKKIWEQTFPGQVYEHRFLDDKIETFYKQENQLSQLYKIFAGIAIFLSCLGLYGLASFMSVQRMREVGIRKVLGASAASIVYLFSKEFILLISIAFVIAVPLTWYYMHHWLQDYAYRISIHWWLFAAGGFTAIMLALITISLHAFKAARSNPVKNLKME